MMCQTLIYCCQDSTTDQDLASTGVLFPDDVNVFSLSGHVAYSYCRLGNLVCVDVKTLPRVISDLTFPPFELTENQHKRYAPLSRAVRRPVTKH